MINLILVGKNRLFQQSLKIVLETKKIALVLTEATYLEELLPVLSEFSIDLLILDVENESLGFNTLKKIIFTHPNIKCITLSSGMNSEKYYQLIDAGVKGSVDQSLEIEELFVAIQEVYAGKIHFPHEPLQELISQHNTIAEADIENMTEREKQVLQLLCEGLSNLEISQKLHLSEDTIRWYRNKIMLKCGCNNILSLYKYAMKHQLINPEK